MPPSDNSELLSCDDCGNVAVGTGPIACCEARMTPTDPADPVVEPELEDLLCDVFGMSDSELEICLCVMEGGTMTVDELADRVSYDRSVVSRHLNDLAALGVVEKRRRLIKQGGHVYVYRPVEPEVVRQRLAAAFTAWVRVATERIADLQREKIAAIADAGDDDPAWKLFRED
jgi:predicted transcriptional regulator